MTELTITRSYKSGDGGKVVRRIQEWLSLRGIGVVTDGDFGPATEFAVRQWQAKAGLEETGIVTPKTYETLVQIMATVLKGLTPRGGLGQMVASNAKRHLRASPREIGGQNRGPWVRLYMKGNQGDQWPWCAGFACFVLQQACDALHTPMPIEASFSCDLLAVSAKQRERFLPGRSLDRSRIRPGMLFLNRRTPSDWTHVGIVIKGEEECFLTIEGNTNDEGSREGYEVCQRVRGYRNKDFIVI